MKTERQQLVERLEQLKVERQEFESDWRDIYEQVLPYRPNWDIGWGNRHKHKKNILYNNLPIESMNTMVAGFMAGITSPNSDWWNLTTTDPVLQDSKRVRKYLQEVERITDHTLARSSWYDELASCVYPDLGAIAVGAMICEEDEKTDVRFEGMEPGSFWIDTDKNNDLDTCFRKLSRTTRWVVQTFGYEACSPETKKAWDEGRLSDLKTIYQAIFPNVEWKRHKKSPTTMRFASRWWEENDSRPNGFLRKSGYEEFPVFAPRWKARAGDAYGRGSPGWQARGDCKALQHKELTLAKLEDKSAEPPMIGQGTFEGRPSTIPGEITYMSSMRAGKFEPAMTVQPSAIQAVREGINDVSERIRAAFFVNLWTAILNDKRAQRATATEIEQVKTEVMLQLGPLLQTLNKGLLAPAIKRVIAILERKGRLPPPPEEILNAGITIEFISVLHQAQQITRLAGIREFVGRLMDVAQAKPQVLDKLNEDQLVDELAKVLGVKVEIVRSDEEVKKLRNAKAVREQAAQQGEAMAVGARAAKDFSSADPDRLRELASMITPAASPGGAV